MSTTLQKILKHPFLFSQVTPLYIILPNVLFTCTGYFLKIFPPYTTGQKSVILTSILLKLPLWQHLTRGISTPLYISVILTFQKLTHIHLGLIFHQSLLAYPQSSPSLESDDQNKPSLLIFKFTISPLSPNYVQNKHITDFWLWKHYLWQLPW